MVARKGTITPALPKNKRSVSHLQEVVHRLRDIGGVPSAVVDVGRPGALPGPVPLLHLDHEAVEVRLLRPAGPGPANPGREQNGGGRGGGSKRGQEGR